MNGQPTINHPANHNEQLIGKFHVVNVDKLASHDEAANNAPVGQQLPPASSSTTDESGCASRFQMIRVDRNFGRGRWKVNDYEPPENIASSTNPPVNTIENEPVNISNSTNLSTIPPTSVINAIPANIPPNLLNDSNATSSATLAATAASAAAATATAFQQHQQRMAMNNPAAMVPPANVPPPAGLLHPYPPAALANMTAPNQSYLLPNHPQFGYYPYFPPPYSPYAAQWAALAAANPYLPPPIPPSQLSTGNLGDPLRLTDGGPDITNENNPFPNASNDHLQNAQLAAAASFIYAAHHPHSTYVSQPPPTTASPYATIPAYHPAQPPPTIIPPATQPLSLAQVIANNTTDIQQQYLAYQALISQQQAPILTSPKHEASAAKNPTQQSTAPRTTATTTPAKSQTTASNGINIDTLKTINPTHITDLLSSSPSIPNSQQPPPSLLSPITVQGANPNKPPASSLNDIWPYTATGSPLNLSQTAAQTAAVTAVAAMGLLNNENSQSTEIANEILKELTTPTKQNITTDIDNKISAAMDLVKMHLLSAVREEVTELRQQIRTLNEKVNSVEHENAFLRQHVPSEIYAQYTPLSIASSAANDPTNPSSIGMTTAPPVPLSSVIASQPIPMTSLSSLPLSLAQQPSTSTNSQTVSVPPPLPSSSTNLPPN
jgi:polyhydroxyalkanoate synthesis regulator phasin